jgi:hypothetical protein
LRTRALARLSAFDVIYTNFMDGEETPRKGRVRHVKTSIENDLTAEEGQQLKAAVSRTLSSMSSTTVLWVVFLFLALNERRLD